MQKDKQIIFLTNFSYLNSTYTTHKILINYLKIKFKFLFLINAENLIGLKKKRYFFSKEVLNRPKNVIIKNFSRRDFIEFTREKKNIVILNLSKDHNNFNIYKILKPSNYKVMMVNNLGNFQKLAITDKGINFLKFFIYIYKKIIFPKILTFFSNIGITTKIDIRFMSNATYLKNIKKNIFKNFLYKNGFLLTKKIIIINSKMFDLSKIEKIKLSNKYIIHLDQDLQYKHVIEVTKFDKFKIERHYKNLNIFLERLSKILKKKVIVSIHPAYNQKMISKKLPKFKVIKYKTRDLIKQSYLVTFFESSSIVDAILLKKKTLALKSEVIGNESIYTKKLNIPIINFFQNLKISKSDLTKLINSKNRKLKAYIRNHHMAGDRNTMGLDKICQEIKNI